VKSGVRPRCDYRVVGDHQDGLVVLPDELSMMANDFIGALAIEIAGGSSHKEKWWSDTMARAIVTRCSASRKLPRI